jgi:excisionase family DNA binding protein
MENLTFNELPQAVTQLYDKLNNIERLLLEQGNEQPQETESWFDLSGLCNYLPDKPARATVYGWVHAGTIPVHKGQKKLRFLKSEIDQWLKTGKRKTLSELAAEAETYLKKKGGNSL